MTLDEGVRKLAERIKFAALEHAKLHRGGEDWATLQVDDVIHGVAAAMIVLLNGIPVQK